MRHLLKGLLPFLVIANIMVGVSAAAAHGTLSIGRTTDNVVKAHANLQPIATYLAARLMAEGVTEGRVVVDGDNRYQVIVDRLDAGTIDVVLESPFSAAYYLKYAGAVPILLVSREGSIDYRSYIFVRADSPLRKPSDLVGHIMACEDQNSTSSFRWPQRTLSQLGFKMAPARNGSAVPDGMIGYVFAGSEINISSWVFYGKVSAGCLSSADWIDPQENPETFRQAFRIIHETEPIPRLLVMTRKDLPAALRTRIRQELLVMHETRAGWEALRNYRIDRFVELTPAASDLVDALAAD